MTRSLSSAVIALGLLSCRDAAKPPDAGPATALHAWPELPRTAEATAALIQSSTHREVPQGERAIDEKTILGALRSHSGGQVISGENPIIGDINDRLDRDVARGRDAYLIFGTFHDSAGQIDAFRRLIGPGGLRGLALVAIEPIWANGAWRNADNVEQRGDDEALARYLATGDATAYSTLVEAQRDHDYAAWKFGYVPAVLDLAVAARAASIPLIGCDMPRTLTEATHADRERGDFDRVREIHCLNAVKSAFEERRLARPRRIAMMWGQAHAMARGLRRFLAESDASTLSIFAFGHREGDWTIEAALAKTLCVSDPVLVPLTGDELALLLPDRALGCDVDRVGQARAENDSGPPLLARSTMIGTLTIDGNATPIEAIARPIPIESGDHVYALVAGDLTMVGAVAIRPNGRVELVFDPPRRAVSITYVGPNPH